MRKEKHRVWDHLKLLHPKNLAKEVHIYGYHFSWKTHVLFMLGTLAGISAVGIVFKLSAVYFFIVAAAAIVLLPVLILDMYKKMYEQKRFADAAAYMEQMLYSFLKTGKVISALKESREIFEDGQMRRTIEAAIGYLEEGKEHAGQGLLRESLSRIEAAYPCTKLRVVHNLLINAEEYGGEAEASVMLVLEDLEVWKRRGYQLQADKKKSHTDNIISIIVATAMCMTALYVLNAMKDMFAPESPLVIFRIGAIQISSVLFILLLYIIFVKSSKSLTADWLAEEGVMDSAYILQCYETVKDYERPERKGKSVFGGFFGAGKRSLWVALLLLIGAIIFMLRQHYLIAAIVTMVGIFVMIQHKIGYHLAKKDLTREMYLALPQWLMELALLLQNNNVEVSIVKSREGVPAALQGELDALIGRMEKTPGKLSAYTDFCKAYDMPEVQSCMKMLHALSENGTGDIKMQMNHLIQRVNEMQNKADILRSESAAFRMKMIFSYPVIAATGKLLADLTMGMVVMFGLLGSMGGA